MTGPRSDCGASRTETLTLSIGDSQYPIAEELPGRPKTLFLAGDRPQVLEAARVAIVGTRSATPAGLQDARLLGRFLAGHGVSIVSGMAIGVDAYAHLGALEITEAEDGLGAGPVGVLATGLDIVYPRRHRPLFERVRRCGVLLTEHPDGTPPHPGRFPVRNRIIAALADVVVVVEATLRGGSRITAERALDYGRPVLAVPGSRRNPAAAGCNSLLADGAQPLLDPSDVLLALGMTPGARRGWETDTARRSLSPGAAQVKRALAGEPAHPDELAARTGLPGAALAIAMDELVAAGHAERARGYLWPI